MENVQAPWVGQPPEEPTAVCHCDWCDQPLYEYDEAYELEGATVCIDCAEEYLEEHKKTL